MKTLVLGCCMLALLAFSKVQGASTAAVSATTGPPPKTDVQPPTTQPVTTVDQGSVNITLTANATTIDQGAVNVTLTANATTIDQDSANVTLATNATMTSATMPTTQKTTPSHGSEVKASLLLSVLPLLLYRLSL